jgi:hypothetical protein
MVHAIANEESAPSGPLSGRYKDRATVEDLVTDAVKYRASTWPRSTKKFPPWSSISATAVRYRHSRFWSLLVISTSHRALRPCSKRQSGDKIGEYLSMT